MPASLFRSAVCGLAVALSAVPALAADDAAAVADLFRQAIEATGKATLTYDSATSEAATVTLTNVAITADDGTVTSVPALIFAGLAERAGGGFFAATVEADWGSIRGEHRTIAWQTAEFGQVSIPSQQEIATAQSVAPFLEASAGTITLTDSRLAAPLSIAAASATVTSAPDGSPAGIAVDVDRFTIPVGLFSGTVPGMLLQMMEYKELVANIALAGSYDAATEVGTLQVLSIDAPDAGKITLRGEASGLAFAEAISPDDEVSKDARANARLNQLSVRIDNAGFVERMLDAQAAMLGGSRDDIRAQLIGGALPLALSFVKNEPFRAEFLAAATTFLQDPKSLTIRFQPAEPVPLGQFVRTLTRSPAALPDLLSPAVEANTAEHP